MKKIVLAIVVSIMSFSALAAETPRLVPWYGARVHECQIVLGMKNLQEVAFASVGRTYDNLFTRLREEAKTLAKKNGLKFDTVAYQEPIAEGRYIIVEEYNLLKCD
ncbi:hypothetical protein EZV61_02730 [Corallincola luteus]|uniref:DUF4156 domain-containing protein n=1 Tax=Corallincola luteus TaxID=1775177 RepID=A0ABY2ANZ9_9GAMM|nr:hypothetical protein [Corallincola luteus]TCI04900.1 hypothetical protein EZV61_02730 [Corallincola luteus]